jgi:hypothetical protein
VRLPLPVVPSPSKPGHLKAPTPGPLTSLQRVKLGLERRQAVGVHLGVAVPEDLHRQRRIEAAPQRAQQHDRLAGAGEGRGGRAGQGAPRALIWRHEAGARR